MKIGQSDKYFSESRKENEKSGLLKNDSINSLLENIPSNYDYVEDIAIQMYERIKKYAIEDLVRAVFCINLWRRNRSALAQSLTLNMTLSNFDLFGTLRIQNYDQFRKFYEEIKDLLVITIMEDYTVDDYGEVFIKHLGKTYPIIIGTGHQQVYAMVRYLQGLSKISNLENELQSLLEYIKLVIESTIETNEANFKEVITYELPSESFWQTIVSLFDNPLFHVTYSKAFDVMGYTYSPIEMRHFIEKDNIIYPLWNSSILVDYYKILLNSVSDEKIGLSICSTITSILDQSFNFASNSPNRVLISPHIVDKAKKKSLISSGLIFATITKNAVILGVDGNCFTRDNKIEDFIRTINGINTTSELCLLEPILRSEENGYLGLNVKQGCDIIYIVVDSLTDVSSSCVQYKDKNIKIFECTALDLLYLIGFSDSFEEVQEFIQNDLSMETQIFSFGGKSNFFLLWKNAHHTVATGAFEYDNVFVDFNETERYTLSYFRDYLTEFPRNSSELFIDPLNWNVLPPKNGYSKVRRRGCRGFGGDLRKIGKNEYVFLAHNVEFVSEGDLEQSIQTSINVLEDLNQELFVRYAEQISKFEILRNRTLQLLFMPWSYACKKHKNSFLKDAARKVVYGDIYIETNTVIIRYSVNPGVLLDLIESSTDRTGENTYFKELLKPLAKYSPNSYKELEEKISEHTHMKKTVGVFTVKQYYYFSDKAVDTGVNAIGLAKARKEIAKACFASGAKQGQYRGQSATKLIRGMQESAVKSFEKMIVEFDQFDLHCKALNYLAIQQNGIILNAKRYMSFNDLDEEVLDKFEKSTRKIREDYRRNSDTAKYLIETNLTISRESDGRKCSCEDLSCLLSFADWLVELQVDADVCYHQNSDFIIEVDDTFVVDPIPSDTALRQYEERIKRKYNTTDYFIKNDNTDIEFMKRATQAFECDTGVNFRLLISLIEYMQLRVVNDSIATEIYPNVFEIESNKLESAFFDVLVDRVDIKKIRETINFITLDTSKLKTIDGVQHNLLPIWEREKRKDRFDVKPIIIKEDKYIFSPVILASLMSVWQGGIIEWFLPYEIGLSKLKEVLVQWKKRYEDEMVQDIAKLFQLAKFDIVIPELELYKRFPNKGYPQELGDYDVFAINNARKEVWLIESKVLQKVASIFEIQMQQKNFFMKHKDDEKFQRRIDYMKQNIAKVLYSCGFVDSDYKVVPYMVTNKLFESRYKDVSFPIITLAELQEILSNLS